MLFQFGGKAHKMRLYEGRGEKEDKINFNYAFPILGRDSQSVTIRGSGREREQNKLLIMRQI